MVEMMNEEELIEFLTDNLTLDLSQDYWKETVTIKLMLKNETISTIYLDVPNKES